MLVRAQNFQSLAKFNCLEVTALTKRALANRSERPRKSYAFDNCLVECAIAYLLEALGKAYIPEIFALVESAPGNLLQRGRNVDALHAALEKHESFNFVLAQCFFLPKLFKSLI